MRTDEASDSPFSHVSEDSGLLALLKSDEVDCSILKIA